MGSIAQCLFEFGWGWLAAPCGKETCRPLRGSCAFLNHVPVLLCFQLKLLLRHVLINVLYAQNYAARFAGSLIFFSCLPTACAVGYRYIAGFAGSPAPGFAG